MIKQLIKDKNELLEKLMSIGSNNNENVLEENPERDREKNNEDLKKENEILQKRVIQLNEYTTDLNNQINKLNIKYQEQKNEINNLKDVSYSLINKQKNELIKKDYMDKISPDTHFIISEKKYNKLKWYLLSNFNPENQNNQKKIINYDNFSWVTGLQITPNMLDKFKKFINYNEYEDDDNKKNDLYSYTQKLYDKLEEKEEEISKKDLIIRKLNKELQNKTANIKDMNFLNNLNKSNSNQNVRLNIINTNSCKEFEKDIHKFNLLNKLNDNNNNVDDDKINRSENDSVEDDKFD